VANLQISDELDAELALAAERLGRTKDDLAQEAISARLLDELSAEHPGSDTDFTEEEIAKLRRGLDQLNRGEVVSGEEIEAKFTAWRQRRAAR